MVKSAHVATPYDLEETRQKYGSVFDYMLEGCQIISRDYHYLYVNDVVANQGQSTKQQLIGSTMMERYPGIEKSAMFSHLKECMAYGTPYQMENEFVFPDGSLGWFELRIEPVPEGAMILSIDITERKLLELRRHELDSLKSTFIDVVAHQLRTPLTNIRWQVEKALPTAKGEQQAHLDTIHNNTLEVVRRIDDMVDALNIDSVRLHNTRTSLEKIWQPIYAGVEGRAKAKKIHLEYEQPKPALPRVYCDPQKIGYVMQKMVDNSLLYTHGDGHVEVLLEKTDGKVRFKVTDTGIGIPAYGKQHIFSRFFRSKEALLANTDASGLSLFMAKLYMERHNGNIGYSSKLNVGSVFWFDLPVAGK